MQTLRVKNRIICHWSFDIFHLSFISEAGGPEWQMSNDI
jgi:hypothetical protein